MSSDTYYLRNRSYRPTTGRFLTEDPIRDGLNWYNYCSNNPVLKSDPSGLYEVYEPNTRLYVDIADPIEASRYSTNPYERLSILIESRGWTMYEGMSLEDIYWGNMSPYNDGIGMAQAVMHGDLDYWYPLPEHQYLYWQGVEFGKGVNATVGTLAVALSTPTKEPTPDPDPVPPAKIPETSTKRPRFEMNLELFGHKRDIKMVDDVAREMGGDRNLFRQYIHEMKDFKVMKPNQNFTYEQLKNLAKDLQ